MSGAAFDGYLAEQMQDAEFRASYEEAQREFILTAVEAHARQLAGGIHARGPIPARCWRQAIAHWFLREPLRDPEWAEAMIARWTPEVSNQEREPRE